MGSFRDLMREPQKVEAVSACRSCSKPIERRGQLWYVTGAGTASDICLTGRGGCHKPVDKDKSKKGGGGVRSHARSAESDPTELARLQNELTYAQSHYRRWAQEEGQLTRDERAEKMQWLRRVQQLEAELSRKRPTKASRGHATRTSSRSSYLEKHQGKYKQPTVADEWDVAMDAILEGDAKRAAQMVRRIWDEGRYEELKMPPRFSDAVRQAPDLVRGRFRFWLERF